MTQEAKTNLLSHLKTQDQNDLKQYFEIALIAGNQILFEAINKIDSKKNYSKAFENKSIFFDICKYGNSFSFETYTKNKNSKLIIDDDNNSCLHIASEYGNLQV